MKNKKVLYIVFGLIAIALTIGFANNNSLSQADSTKVNILFPGCGDGIVDKSIEYCDDGNMNENDECTSMCMPNLCADGWIHEGVEECDDGNLLDGDGCDGECKLE